MVVMLLIVSILGITSVYSETCPSDEEIAPCTCENLTSFGKTGNIKVKCLNFGNREMEELTNQMKYLIGKKNVELQFDGFDLSKVPMDVFNGIGVIQLEISNCKLANVRADQVALQGLEDTLEELNIRKSFNENNDLTGLKLGHLRKLRKLEFYLNSITEVPNTLMENSPLEELSFLSNKIQKLGDRAFASLSNLKTLELTGNNFGPLIRNMLPTDANRLTFLVIKDNGLTSLEEDVFSNMPALSQVYLNINKISKLEKNTWKHVWEQLFYADLEGNPIQCDSDLEWTFNYLRPLLSGTCTEPASQNGRGIVDFIDKKGQ